MPGNEDRDIEKKIEEKLEEKLDQKLEENIDKIESNSGGSSKRDEKGTEEISRREFLKKTGLGAAGLSALALLPSTSAFNIRTSNPLQYFNSSNPSEPNFRINQSGNIDANDANLAKIIADRIEASNEMKVPTSNATGNDNQIWLDTDGQSLKAKFGGTKYKTDLQLAGLVDSFEDQDLTEYSSIGGAGSSSIVSTEPQEGSYHLRVDVSSGGSHGIASPEAGNLNAYPQEGDTYRVWANPRDQEIFIGYFYQGTPSSGSTFDTPSYYVTLGSASNRIFGRRGDSDGNTKFYSNTSVSVSNQWYEVIISIPDTSAGEDTHSVTINDASGNEVDSFTFTDTTYTSGGVWFGENNDTADSYGWFDYARVE